MHPAGVEPAPPPWQGGTLPLRHGCLFRVIHCVRTDEVRAAIGFASESDLSQLVKELGQSPIARLAFNHKHIRHRGRKSTEWDSNPRCRITNADSSPLEDPCKSSSERKVTSHEGVRLRFYSSLVPLISSLFIQWGRRDSNPRLSG